MVVHTAEKLCSADQDHIGGLGSITNPNYRPGSWEAEAGESWHNETPALKKKKSSKSSFH